MIILARNLNPAAMVPVVRRLVFVTTAQKPAVQTVNHPMINAGRTAMRTPHAVNIPLLGTLSAHCTFAVRNMVLLVLDEWKPFVVNLIDCSVEPAMTFVALAVKVTATNQALEAPTETSNHV